MTTTIAIKDYILANYDSSIIQESLENLEYYKIDIIMSFSESVTGKRNVNSGEKSCSEIQYYMQNLMKKAKEFDVSKLNIEVIGIKRDCRKVKIVLEDSLGYFNIKGLAENDLFAEQLSEELVNIGTSMK
ncbi:hypothetical protein [Coprococcus sp. RTP31081st1_D2_RTP31081_211007]|uniref:hypothetical protein n=1 Tax=unclassified Coprococcus TaxID=2684943 RepID=UPI0032EA9F14